MLLTKRIQHFNINLTFSDQGVMFFISKSMDNNNLSNPKKDRIRQPY